jgi:hypothetical protein
VVVEEIGIGALIGLALTWLTIRMLRFSERQGWISKNWVEIPIVALAAGVLCGGGGRQRVHRVLCRRALAERAPASITRRSCCAAPSTWAKRWHC